MTMNRCSYEWNAVDVKHDDVELSQINLTLEKLVEGKLRERYDEFEVIA